MTRSVALTRDCPALRVPGGQPVVLGQGTPVTVLQTLGGAVTVRDERGRLARIAEGDADALGLGAGPVAPSAPTGPARFSADAVIDALRTVYDPEIPINVVDLGLVYDCAHEQFPDGTHQVHIRMSMTAPGCGMGDVLKEDARRKVAAVPGVGAVDVELVWDPPWDLDRLSEEARLELGMW